MDPDDASGRRRDSTLRPCRPRQHTHEHLPTCLRNRTTPSLGQRHLQIRQSAFLTPRYTCAVDTEGGQYEGPDLQIESPRTTKTTKGQLPTSSYSEFHRRVQTQRPTNDRIGLFARGCALMSAQGISSLSSIRPRADTGLAAGLDAPVAALDAASSMAKAGNNVDQTDECRRGQIVS